MWIIWMRARSKLPIYWDKVDFAYFKYWPGSLDMPRSVSHRTIHLQLRRKSLPAGLQLQLLLRRHSNLTEWQNAALEFEWRMKKNCMNCIAYGSMVGRLETVCPVSAQVLTVVHRDSTCLGIVFAMSSCLIGSYLTWFWIAQQQDVCGYMAFCGHCGRRLLVTARMPLAFNNSFHDSVCSPFRSCGIQLLHILWMTNLEDMTMTTHASVFVPDCGGALRGLVSATCLCISLHLSLPESGWVTLIGLAICSCCCIRAQRSQEANWHDFAHIFDELRVNTCPTWAFRRQPKATEKCFPVYGCFVAFSLWVSAEQSPHGSFQFVCGLRWPCWPLMFSSTC